MFIKRWRAILVKPSAFGKFLKKKRKAAALTQDDIATTINKTSQYISNIEKGKNNAPPNSADIETLISVLGLDDVDAKDFRRLAAADRNQLSKKQMAYLLKNKTLLALIDFGVENKIKDSCWKNIFSIVSNGSKR